MLEQNPDLKQALISFGKENLNELSAKRMSTYLHTIALPALLETKRQELEDDEYGMDKLLEAHGLTKVSLSTIYRWMDKLGFKYKPRRKGYSHFDFVFLFDHSCGHDRQRPDGLSVTKTNVFFGKGQPKMRESTIEAEQNYLGPFERTLNVGDKQSMIFNDGDVGPFYMTEAERANRREDRFTGTSKTKKRLKSDLQKELTSRGVNASGNYKTIRALAVNNNVPVDIEVPDVEEGWVGKPKGSLQILWERGFIDGTKRVSDYSLHGKKDEYGTVVPSTSLKMMMTALLDFIEEETLLQYYGRMMGVLVDRTPKCHPELAGEGIEYAWGCAKGVYRRYRMSEKRGKDNFRESVRRCTSRDNVLTTTRMRKFSRRARQYIMAYKAILSRRNLPNHQNSMTEPLIEKVVKVFRTHRSAADFDSKFILEAVVSSVYDSQ